MYNLHPDPFLVKLFKEKPYQGVSPEKSSLLFIGLDANYNQDISKSPLFDAVKNYHEDGVAFWQKNGVHHPFLLSSTRIDGQKYHKNFAKLGFGPRHADKISFVELLHLPTFGRNNCTLDDLDENHLVKINKWILEGNATSIFLSTTVAKLMFLSGVFDWLPKKVHKMDGQLGSYFKTNNKTVYAHLHFSVYGKFDQARNQEAKWIRQLLD
jgi:hypothetical protein